MQINCPQCKTEALATNINLDKMVSKCHNCNSVYNFEEELSIPPRKRREVFLPEGMEILKLGEELSIEVKWRKTASSFLLLFTIIWNTFLIPFVLGAVLSGELMILAAISVHLAVGIGLAYYTLTTLLNTSYLIADPSNLIVEHRPLKLPFYPDRAIPTHEVDQIFVKKYSSGKTNGNAVWAYAVEAKLTNGENVNLIKGVKNGNHALFVEQEIEKHLKIKDKSTSEEWQG